MDIHVSEQFYLRLPSQDSVLNFQTNCLFTRSCNWAFPLVTLDTLRAYELYTFPLFYARVSGRLKEIRPDYKRYSNINFVITADYNYELLLIITNSQT